MKKQKTIVTSILLCLLMFLPITAKANEEYSDLIAIPKDSFQAKHRLARTLVNRGIYKYKTFSNGSVLIPLNKGKSYKSQIELLEKTGAFQSIEPNYILKFDSERTYTQITKISQSPINIDKEDINEEIIPNDSKFEFQYYLNQINAPKAWGRSQGQNIKIAILDSGIEADHQDLIGKISGREGFDDLTDDLGHGTEIAGIIGANSNNGKGIAGVAWHTNILSLKVTDENAQAKVSTVIEAIDYAIENDAKIIHISLSTNQYSKTLESYIKKALDNDILVVSTAGNTGVNEARYPAGFDGVVGVGAIDKFNVKESYSTSGPHVSLVAPGSLIFTTEIGSNYTSVSGTSFSAPQISATAGLVWALNPTLTSSKVREILFQSATDLGTEGRDDNFGYGLINTEKAVTLAQQTLNP